MKRLLRTMVGLAGALLILGAGMMFVFRSGSPRLLKAVKTFNKRYLNPLMLRWAGTRGFYASALCHVGRVSGRHYRTPVLAEPIPGGFLIPLPYGREVDWLTNVRTAGSAELIVNGRPLVLDRPEIISAAEATPHLTPRLRRRLNAYGVSEYLRIHVADRTAVPAES